MKFEENWQRGFKGEVVQTCGRTDDDGQQVITIAYPEPSAQMSKIDTVHIYIIHGIVSPMERQHGDVMKTRLFKYIENFTTKN